jgi:hypothetical protein
MVTIQKSRDGDALRAAVAGKIDEGFDGAAIATDAAARLVIDLSGVRSISSLGVRALESFLASLAGRNVTLVEVSPAIASQLAMIPNLAGAAKVESARLPFVCPACGAERDHSVPYRAGASTANAPRCDCGARMDLDGVAEQYLPSA